MGKELTVKLKVCGVTQTQDMVSLVGMGVPFIGLITEVPGTPRRLDLKKALSLASIAPQRTVFVVADPSDSLLRALVRVAPAAIQFHGQEDPRRLSWVRSIVEGNTEVWKALPISLRTHPEPFREVVDRFVLERPKTPPAQGPFPLALALNLMEEARKPVLAAGGITPESALGIAQSLNPYGIDMASGVEKAPGIKNLQAIHEVLAALSAEKILDIQST